MQVDQLADLVRGEREPGREQVVVHHARRRRGRTGGSPGTPAKSSGAMKVGVPADGDAGQLQLARGGGPGRSRRAWRGPSAVSRTFAGLTSRWTSPDRCAAPSARTTWRTRVEARIGSNGPSRTSVSLRLTPARDVLHLDEVIAPVAPQVVDRHDVRVDQVGDRPGLGPELLADLRLPGDQARVHHLDGAGPAPGRGARPGRPGPSTPGRSPSPSRYWPSVAVDQVVDRRGSRRRSRSSRSPSRPG